MASLTRTAPYRVSRIPPLVPVKSTASVSPTSMCSSHDTRRTVAYRASASPAGPAARTSRTRLASRDQRQARQAVSSVPSKDTPARAWRTWSAPRPRNSPARSDSRPGGTVAKKDRPTAQGYHRGLAGRRAPDVRLHGTHRDAARNPGSRSESCVSLPHGALRRRADARKESHVRGRPGFSRRLPGPRRLGRTGPQRPRSSSSRSGRRRPGRRHSPRAVADGELPVATRSRPGR